LKDWAKLHHSYHTRRGADVVLISKQKHVQFANRQEPDGFLQQIAHLNPRKSAGCLSRTHVATAEMHGIWKGIVLETNIFKALTEQRLEKSQNGRDLERRGESDIAIFTEKGSGASKMHRGVTGTNGMIPIAHSRYRSTQQYLFRASGSRTWDILAACTRILTYSQRVPMHMRASCGFAVPEFHGVLCRCHHMSTLMHTAVHQSLPGLTRWIHVETLSHITLVAQSPTAYRTATTTNST
jgi:hypothetical protein